MYKKVKTNGACSPSPPLLLFGKISPQRQCPESEKKRGFYPILFLNRLNERNAEKNYKNSQISK